MIGCHSVRCLKTLWPWPVWLQVLTPDKPDKGFPGYFSLFVMGFWGLGVWGFVVGGGGFWVSEQRGFQLSCLRRSFAFLIFGLDGLSFGPEILLDTPRLASYLHH